ncbi:MAG: hypothetical protein ACRC6I_01050 [Paracoccaceae bacterium]
MTYVERGALLQALRALAVYALYLTWMQGYHADGTLYAAGAEVLVGKAALWLIGLTVGAGLLVQIGVTILSGITRDENLAHLFDERDKQIERRAIETGFGIVGAGFLALMAALAAAWPVGIALNLLVLAFVLADLTVNLIKFRAYLKGF